MWWWASDMTFYLHQAGSVMCIRHLHLPAIAAACSEALCLGPTLGQAP